MRQINFVKLLVVISSILTSCDVVQTSLKYDDLNTLYKGMPKDEFVQKILIAPRLVFSFKRSDKRFEVFVFTFIDRYATHYTGSSTPPITYTLTNETIFLFYEGKLRYWGLENEYFKSEDEEITNFAEDLFLEIRRHR